MKQRQHNRQSLRAIFAMPLVIAALSLIALVVALTGDGWRDALSWAGLGVSVVAVVWAMKTRQS